MIEQAKIKYEELTQTLERVQGKEASKIEKSQQCYREVNASLMELKALRAEHSFLNQRDEIQYFKYVLPGFIEQLIFYTELNRIEAAHPPFNNGIKMQLTRKTLEMLQLFFQRHGYLYQYYRMNRTEFDNTLFLSDSAQMDFYPEIGLLLDSTFYTTGSYIFGRFRAYERLISYLENPTPSPSDTQGEQALAWTESKAAFIELVYALHARGAIDQGRTSLQRIVGLLGKVFQFDPGNVYRAYYDLCLRKKNRTPFIDGLKEALEKRMEESAR